MPTTRTHPLLTLLLALALPSCTDLPTTPLPALHGQTDTATLAKLGPPLHTTIFPMSKATDQFHTALQNTYSLSNPENATVQIKEITWPDGNYRITLWFHQRNNQWTTFDSLRWHKDLRF